MRSLSCFFASLLMLWGCSNQTNNVVETRQQNKPFVNPESWPLHTSPLKRDALVESRISDLLARMTLEEKVGQVIQADINYITPEQAAEYHLGSILNGGNSGPGNDNHAPAERWLALADEFWKASIDTKNGRTGVPIMWGTDAVHGNSNVVGATLFPHNIGLGATNDPQLLHKIGQITALETRVTGLDWTFAPTLAVARNDRWGRTYESYSEDPNLVASYTPHIVSGLQGDLHHSTFLDHSRIIATAKHFVGDGATEEGIDQGDVLIDEEVVRDLHAAGYVPAIQSGVQVVMASFNSWNGARMHGSKVMLSDILVGRLGFDGFVVGDWNGHAQVKGCSKVSCAQAFNAGLDMFMAPDSWKGLYKNLLKQVKSGVVSQQRLDEAVARILRVKLRAGVFDAGLPSNRPMAGEFELLGHQEHRAVAREAVRKSLVLLKNNNQLLPLRPNINVLVTGEGANNIAQQAGGWTLTWQGNNNNPEHFPNAQSIYQGIQQVVSEAGGHAELSQDGSFNVRPDVAIVVFGEQPYAEFQGDLQHLDYVSNNGLRLLKRFKQQNIPTVAVFLSGRPLWVNPEINQSDAFVAAWLPGSEGGGIGDLMFTDAAGKARFDFTGRLSFSWPAKPSDDVLNEGNTIYSPLFPIGYGLSLQDNAALGPLSEDINDEIEHVTRFVYAGDPVVPWRMMLKDRYSQTQVTSKMQTNANGTLTAVATDDKAQEDTVMLTWTGDATLAIEGKPIDLTQQVVGDMTFQIVYKVIQSSSAKSNLILGCGEGCSVSMDISSSLQAAAGKGWQTAQVKLSCFAASGANLGAVQTPFSISSSQGLILQLKEVKVVSNPSAANCTL